LNFQVTFFVINKRSDNYLIIIAIKSIFINFSLLEQNRYLGDDIVHKSYTSGEAGTKKMYSFMTKTFHASVQNVK